MSSNHKSTVAIVTDSAARLAPEWAQAHRVVALPQYVCLNGRTYREDVDLDEDNLSSKATKSKKPFTVAAPKIEDFTQVYRTLADEKADVISLHVSSALSETVRNAIRAKEEFRGRCNIHVIDSHSMALGLNELVQSAVKMAECGETADNIVKKLRGLMQHIYGIFISDDMQHLANSKRLRPAQAVLGKMLEIIPCLSLEEGDLVAVEKVRTAERAIEKLTEFAIEFEDPEKMAILQISSHPNARTLELLEALKLSFPNTTIPIQSCGAIVGSIIGPTGLGVMIYEGGSC